MSLWNLISGDDGMCENCRVKPRFKNHDYCGKTCATEAENKKIIEQQKRLAATRASVSNVSYSSRAAGPPGSGAGGGDGAKDDGLCEECHKKPKKRDYDHWSKKWTVYEYCSMTCKESASRRAAQAQTLAQAQARRDQQAAMRAAAPAPPALGRLRLLKKSPASESVYQRFIDRWIGPEGSERPKIEAIYGIMPSDYVAARFDNIMERHTSCEWETVYYAGQWICDSVAGKDENPQLCAWPGCATCIAVKYQFERFEFDKIEDEGVCGPGVYTYYKPADAHPKTVEKAAYKWRAVIQCRLLRVPPSEETPEWNMMVDEKTGYVFCKKEAIIPTHLILYAPPENESVEEDD